MLERRQVFAGLLIGPGTDRLASPQVRVVADTIEAAEAALDEDQARFPGSSQYFRESVVLAESLTLHGWPGFQLVVHSRLGPDDESDMHATLRMDGVGRGWAHADDLDGIAVQLLQRTVGSQEVLRTNPDRSPRACIIPLFALVLRRALGGGFSAETERLVAEWVLAGEALHSRWRSLSAWWPRWCKTPWLVEATGGGEGLQESSGFVVAHVDEDGDYPSSVWWTEESARVVADEGDVYGSEYIVVPVPVLSSPDVEKVALACYRSRTGGYQAALFRLPLPEAGVDPDVEWLRRHQMPLWGSGESREQAWLRVLDDVFRDTLVHFPRFQAQMVELPLAALIHEGYQVPEEIRQHLDAWVQVVETAQQAYASAMTAIKKELPR